MRITTVEYRQLRTFGNYQNESVGAIAVVEPGETTHEALASLKLWVKAELAARQDEAEAREETYGARHELARIERDIEDAKARWEKAKAFLARHGVSVDEPDTELPF
jgi:hypothetical protein